MAASAGAIKTGQAYVDLVLNDKLSRGLKGAERKLKAFGGGVRDIGARLAGVGTAALAGFGAATAHFVSFGDQLDKMGRRTGVSTEALSEFAFAARRSGTSLKDVETGLRRMQRSIYDAGRGLSTQTDALRDLGLQYEDLAGLSPEEQFQRVADALSGVEDATTRAALAQALLGRSGTRLLPMLEDLADLREEARRLGLGISKEDTDAAMRLADAMGDVWDTVKRGLFAVGAAMEPILAPLAKRLSEIIARASGWIDANREWVRWAAKVAAITAAVGAALVVVGTAIVGLGAVFGGLASIASAVGAALSVVLGVLGAILSPIGLAITAVAALGAYFLHTSGSMGKAVEWLKDKFAALADFAGEAFDGIKGALAAGDWGLAADVLWKTLKVAWQKGTHWLETLWLDWKKGFLDTATDAFYGLLTIWTEVKAKVKQIAAEMKGLMKTGVAVFKSWWKSRDVKKRAKAEAETLKGRRDRGEISEAEYDRLAEEAKAKYKAEIAALDEEVKGVGRETAQEIARIEAEREAALVKVSEKAAGAREKHAKQHAEDLAAAEAELADATAEWQNAVEEGKKAGEEAAGKEGPPGPGEEPAVTRDFLADIKKGLGQAGAGVARAAAKSGTMGTFSAFAELALGGSKTWTRMAASTEKSAEHLERIDRNIQTGGARFG